MLVVLAEELIYGVCHAQSIAVEYGCKSCATYDYLQSPTTYITLSEHPLQGPFDSPISLRCHMNICSISVDVHA